MRIVKRVAAGGIIASVALVVLSPELVTAWRAWWSGASVGDYPLWGFDVTFWGRLGKGLQFLAGLVVILDLLSPNRLRARGATARRELALSAARWRRQKTAMWIDRVYRGLDPSLDLGTSPPRERRETLRSRLTPYEYAAWRALGSHTERYRLTTAFFWGSIGLAIAGVPVLTGALGLGPGPNEPVSPLVMFTSGPALLLTIFSLAGIGDLFTIRLIRLVRVAFYYTVASVLDSARPGHKLRWLALTLFVIGTLFDLLAS